MSACTRTPQKGIQVAQVRCWNHELIEVNSSNGRVPALRRSSVFEGERARARLPVSNANQSKRDRYQDMTLIGIAMINPRMNAPLIEIREGVTEPHYLQNVAGLIADVDCA